MKNKLKKLWKKKITKLVVAVALIATGNEFLGVPVLRDLMTPDKVEKVIIIDEEKTTTDSAVIKQIIKTEKSEKPE